MDTFRSLLYSRQKVFFLSEYPQSSAGDNEMQYFRFALENPKNLLNLCVQMLSSL